MVFMLFWECINKPTDLKINNIKLKSPNIKPIIIDSPKIIERIKKNVSTDNFMKYQVPWIL
jgi:hypothetical protein